MWYIDPMSTDAKKLLDDALLLPRTDRAGLAACLIESLEGLMEADCEAAWREEVRRRVHDLDGGQAQTVPWPEARSRILSR